MALNDVVALHLAQSSPTTFQAQPPHFGNVVAETGTTAKTVLWDNDILSDMVAANLADFNLDLISDADAPTIALFKGKVALRIAPGGPIMSGALVIDPAGGTSREFAGAVVSVHRRTAVQSPQVLTGPVYVLIQVHNTDTFYEDLASNFTVLGNR